MKSGREQAARGGDEAREGDQVALQIIYKYVYNYESILLTVVLNCHNSEGSTTG